MAVIPVCPRTTSHYYLGGQTMVEQLLTEMVF